MRPESSILTPESLLVPAVSAIWRRLFRNRGPHLFFFIVGYALIHSLLTYLSQELQYGVGKGTGPIALMWLPTGWLAAVLAMLRWKYWLPVILVAGLSESGAYLSRSTETFDNLEIHSLLFLLIALLGNLSTSICFAMIYRWLCPSLNPMHSTRDFLRYLIVCIGLVTVVVSLITNSLIALNNWEFSVDHNWLLAWQQWWMADLSTLLVISTPLLLLGTIEFKQDMPWWRWLEAIMLLMVETLYFCWHFSVPRGSYELYYLWVPIMFSFHVWAVLSFNALMLSLATMIIALSTVYSMVDSTGLWGASTNLTTFNALNAQGFIVGWTFITLFVMTIFEDRNRYFSRQLETEKRLRAMDRIEAIGTMSAGVAHDFGNLVLAIRAYESTIRANLKDPSPALEQAIQGLGESAAAAQTMIQALLRFGRQEQSEGERSSTTDVCAAVTETCESLGPLIASKCHLSSDIPEGSIVVKMEENDLQRMLRNLVLNARDAIGQDGRVVLGVRLQSEMVDVYVQDNGMGIPEEKLEKIFDPFFTTKSRGKGTGLGLSVVQGMVQESGGSIRVESRVGAGTTMHILLPVASTEGVEPEAWRSKSC